MKTITVVGLGLIGASIAAALKGFEDYQRIGVDIDKDTRRYAEENEICDIVTDDTLYAVSRGDVIICCLHPKDTLKFLRKYCDDFLPGTLVTDVCGVKTAVMQAAECIGGEVDFIGTHPMAGKEKGGIENSTGHLFKGAHYLVTPRKESKSENIELLRRLSVHMGCRDMIITTPEEHDAIIAYTSQLMHVVAVSICDDPFMFECLGFEGGSFRDCTRVAALDPQLWAELFGVNASTLAGTIGRLEKNLKSYREVLEAGDMNKLKKKLTSSSDRKRTMNIEHRRGDDVQLPEQ